MWPWHTMLASAVGAAIPLVPIYIFGFRQVIESKNAQIEVLKQQNERLKQEVVAEIIREKQVLVEDLKARAKEKVELEEATQKEIDKITAQLESVVKQRRILDATVESRMSERGQVGVLLARISLVRVRAWLSGLVEMSDPIARGMSTFLDRELADLKELQVKISEGADLLTESEAYVSADIFKQLQEDAMVEKMAILGERSAGT